MIEDTYNDNIRDLEFSLDKYMKNLPESPLSLPIKTKIIFEKRNVLIDHIIVMPTDNGAKFYDFIFNYFKNLGDEITEFLPDSYFCIIKNENMMENIIKIEKDSKLVSIGLISGETVYLKGDVALKSEIKKNCFSFEFDKFKQQQIVKYFSCENCNLNCNFI